MNSRALTKVAALIVLMAVCAIQALAADPQVSAQDLKGISPKRHRYWFAVGGGAAIGMGIGALLGGGNDLTKGVMIGGGGASALYLHHYRQDPLGGWRSWATIGGYTALGGGLGWTICGCNDGLAGGLLIGGGAAAISQAMTRRPPRTATGGAPPPKKP